MFGFLKKIFGFGSEDRVSASLMEKAQNSALLSQNNFSSPDDLTSESLIKHYYDHDELDQLQQQQILNDQLQNDLLQQQQLQDLQQMQDMDNLQHMQNMQDLQDLQDLHHDNDPFQNPGLDMHVDEYHHNIDHGMDDHHHDY